MTSSIHFAGVKGNNFHCHSFSALEVLNRAAETALQRPPPPPPPSPFPSIPQAQERKKPRLNRVNQCENSCLYGSKYTTTSSFYHSDFHGINFGHLMFPCTFNDWSSVVKITCIRNFKYYVKSQLFCNPLRKI